MSVKILKNKYIKYSCVIVLCIFIYFVCGHIFKKCPTSDEVAPFYIALDDVNKVDMDKYDYTILSIQEKEWISQNSIDNLTICLATHGTVDRLYWLQKQVDQWQGIISVAVFVPTAFKEITMKIIQTMLACSEDVRRSVILTLVFENPLNRETVQWNQTMDRTKCPQKLDFIFKGEAVTEAQNQMKYITYPQNIMRNLARKNCPTEFTLNVDIDMISSIALSSSLDSFLKRTPVCSKCAFVTPVYEIEKKSSFPPKNKVDLLSKISKKKARRYHITISAENQGNSNLTLWEKLSSKSATEVNILYNITSYKEFWEPILVLHQSAPGFEESFVGYGFTRNSHVFHLHLLDYKFYVLDNAFLSHKGFQEAKNIHDCNRKAQKFRNRILYYEFREKLLKSLGKTEDENTKV